MLGLELGIALSPNMAFDPVKDVLAGQWNASGFI